MRLEKRQQSSALALVLAPIGAVVFTLLVSALLVLWAGAPVGQTYALLLQGAYGSVFALSETLTRAIPLMLTGLAATVAFKAKLFNIGAEGQLYVGALAAVAVGGMHGGTGWDVAPAILFVLMMLAAALAGALLLLGPALMKARLGVDEVVTTLLLNFIVLLLVSLMLDGPMKDPTAMGWPQSVALLSGGLAGLAGAIEVAGRTSYLTLDMSPGYGYSGIVIAMLAALHPLAVVVASVFVAGMLVGADSMSRAVGVPTFIADVIVAASLISVLVATLLTQYRVRWK
jgi:ABC-type uncharacterized transport system permease subunit